MSGLIPEQLKTVLERNAQALQLRPAIGKGTGKTRVRLREGLACEIEDGPWKLTAGVADVPPGYSEVRYRVKIESDAPEEAIRKVLDEADAHCPWFDVYRRPQNLKRIVELVPAAKA